jgi:peptidoglycan/xylan/chitin deacetylase (PgdA/CDA1 family)
LSISKTLRQSVGGILSPVLSAVPLALWQKTFPKDVVSICYHVVSDDDLPHHRLYRYKSPKQFEDDLRFAKARCLSFEELRATRKRASQGSPNRMLITFDDGLAECYDTIRPLLLKHSIDAAFFVSTGFLDDASIFCETTVSLCIDAIERAQEAQCAEIVSEMLRARPLPESSGGREVLRALRVRSPISKDRRQLLLWLLDLEQGEMRKRGALLCGRLGIDPENYVRGRRVYMSSEQVRALAADGFTIGGHGVRHQLMESLTREQMIHEIVASCSTIRDITGQEQVPFAFPYNGLNIDRGFLASVKREYPFIDLFFDSGMLRSEPSFVVNRVFADDPISGTGTTLPHVLSQAWAKPSSWYRTQAANWAVA